MGWTPPLNASAVQMPGFVTGCHSHWLNAKRSAVCEQVCTAMDMSSAILKQEDKQ